MGNNDRRGQKIKGCLIVAIIFGGFLAMGGTAIYLSEIGSKFVMLPVGLYFGTFIIIGIVASLKDVRKRKKEDRKSVV